MESSTSTILAKCCECGCSCFHIQEENRLTISEFENERKALQKTIQDLMTELEEEREASSTATKEAMSMIQRLQREKAELEMEARQFTMLAEEKILELEDMLDESEQTIQSLNGEVEAAFEQRTMGAIVEAEEVGDATENLEGFLVVVYDKLKHFSWKMADYI